MTEQILLCTTDQLSDPGSRGFEIEHNGDRLSGFIVCRDNQYFAYQNQCPHTGAPMDWVEHQFLDIDQAFIQCAVHDARFEMNSGLCISGPCVGDSLIPLKITVNQNSIFMTVAENSAADLNR